jgi:hypothetical protein
VPSDLDAVAESVRRVLRATGNGDLAEFTVVVCRQADDEHDDSARQFAHVGHHDDLTICIADALIDQPPDVQRGILWHEVGHWLVDNYPQDADVALTLHPEFLTDAQAIYRGHTAQYIDEEAMANALVFTCCAIRIEYGEDQVQRA